jgi:hypothetical protein
MVETKRCAVALCALGLALLLLLILAPHRWRRPGRSGLSSSS